MGENYRNLRTGTHKCRTRWAHRNTDRQKRGAETGWLRTICLFFTNGVNLSNNKLFFVIDGIIKKACKDIYLEENSKIINIKDGNSKIIPNLIVDSKVIVANHSAYIGKFNNEDIWYLNSRGINTIDCKKLLLKEILLKNMEDNSKFLDIINHFILDDRKGDSNE